MEFGVLGFVIAGLVVGFIVGMTGVGGGSLMTPILLWFGVTPAAAVGTDLLYAAITKAGGVWVHQKQRNIDWRITGYLAAGSLPAAALMLWVLKGLHSDQEALNAIIKQSLGVVLVLTARKLWLDSQLASRRLRALDRESTDRPEGAGGTPPQDGAAHCFPRTSV